jgi:hypothetical protein
VKAPDLHVPGFHALLRETAGQWSLHCWRKTVKKRMVAKLRAIKTELRYRMREPIAPVGAWLQRESMQKCGALTLKQRIGLAGEAGESLGASAEMHLPTCH